ncbi:MAG: hypothetical protein ACP5E3_02660 [Bacteroidales bacterium]
MNIPRFFKIPRHRQFNYQPLYYDPEKEEREKRNRELKREMGLGEEGKEYKPTIRRGSMKTYFKANKRAERNSNLRLVLIIVFLLFLAYFLLYK